MENNVERGGSFEKCYNSIMAGHMMKVRQDAHAVQHVHGDKQLRWAQHEGLECHDTMVAPGLQFKRTSLKKALKHGQDGNGSEGRATLCGQCMMSTMKHSP